MDSTPRTSRSSSTASASSMPRNKHNLSLDLDSLPAMTQPTPPSNTLLFTNLVHSDAFLPRNLETIRDLINQTASIHVFAPLKSFRRIVVSFYDDDSAIAVRNVWDGESVLGDRLRVYFGQHTNVEARDEHLALPDAGKLFFISPPPSPPHGWEMRLEDAPNKLVHAEDLAEALTKLHHRSPEELMNSPVSPVEGNSAVSGTSTDAPIRTGMRSRSSTLIYRPEDDGKSPDLPAVFFEDMTDEPEDFSPIETKEKPILAHTSRPPVELMNGA